MKRYNIKPEEPGALDIQQHEHGQWVLYADIEQPKLPELVTLIAELENTGWLNPDYIHTAVGENQYIGVEVVLKAIKRLMEDL